MYKCQDPEKKDITVRKEEFVEIYKPFTAEVVKPNPSLFRCGNPYCEWKCPVQRHNYIPNWLKLISEGRIFQVRAEHPGHQTNTLP